MRLFMIVGMETAASILSAIFKQIAKHPAELATLRSEIDELYANSVLFTQDDFEVLPNGVLRRAKFLNAVIHEALLLLPPGAATIHRCTTERCTIEGFILSANVEVLTPFYSLNQRFMNDQKHKGYNPMRFVEGSKLSSRFFAFGKLSRSGIGQEFAMIELCQVIAAMVHYFHLMLKAAGEISGLGGLMVKDFTMTVEKSIF
ncbi:hypothetical protein K7432_008368 [Basidiobolus ranarum]|uniref:Cytochrome P450 n=1 Tax=Basidiobolus ranarum TaxID=34480 RepID=A0ABR2WRZ7_9FUNG